MSQPIRASLPGSGRGASFEQPFEMLEACHERAHRMLALLARLRDHMRTHGADEQARQAARDVMRYFDRAAPDHHRDEELHVFPPLLAEGEPAIVAVVRRLQQDHVSMEQRWVIAREVLQRIEAGDQAMQSLQDDSALDEFASLYGGHIEDEERIVYPAASTRLAGEPLEAMGREMMDRRGVKA